MLRPWSLVETQDRPPDTGGKESVTDPKPVGLWVSWATLQVSASSPRAAFNHIGS